MKKCKNCYNVLEDNKFFGDKYTYCKDCHNEKRKKCPSYINKRVKRDYDFNKIRNQLEADELTKSEIAKLNNIPRSTFYEFINDGRIKYVKPSI